MDDARLTSALDTHIGAPLKPVRRVELLSGMARRRRVWTLEQKLALVAEMERCENIAAFAREAEFFLELLMRLFADPTRLDGTGEVLDLRYPRGACRLPSCRDLRKLGAVKYVPCSSGRPCGGIRRSTFDRVAQEHCEGETADQDIRTGE